MDGIEYERNMAFSKWMSFLECKKFLLDFLGEDSSIIKKLDSKIAELEGDYHSLQDQLSP